MNPPKHHYLALLLLCLAIVPLSGCEADEKPATAPAEEVETAIIRELVEQSVTALNSGEVETLLALHTDDAVILKPHQPPEIGKEVMRASLEFYVSTLGFRIVSRWPENDDLPGWVAIGAGGARLMIRSGHPGRKVPAQSRKGTVTLSLYVDGLDAFRHDLLDAGYRCNEPESLFYGAREFYVLDPEGNEVAIVEFAASDPGYLATAQGGTEK